MSHEALSPEQFTFIKARPKEMGGSHEHQLQTADKTIGSLRWHYRTGEILGVDVTPQHRRQGIATAMLGEARRIAGETRGVTRPRHSAERTDLGEKWARSTGDRLPRRIESYQPQSG